MADFKREDRQVLQPGTEHHLQEGYEEPEPEFRLWDSEPQTFTTYVAIFVGIVGICLLVLAKEISSPQEGTGAPRLSEDIRSFISLSCMQPVVTLWVLTSFSVRHGATLPYRLTLAILNGFVVFMVVKALLP
ncbi:hypothetical protein CC1G_14040 [Coprinopsis cinerea okayama7|uniref:Uncharacterized protein n=1 Tax=Coprinopsis cinerea (strain Okayama-7 / 130 / ATCC MYA-4618 / FGSC 9003) TaxID=240176 RepID=D6RL16_COPC7|nr:hypothetical protein CC1G_14040 [Coprinopsis cinerea okayama7\|eukprot:XP_002912002.1 hypothetical protein CC1G_14040 [Coprinopsis cinerea okayama7\